MQLPLRRISACALAVSLVVGLAPSPRAAGVGARIEGLVLDIDGQPASGFEIVLVEPEGEQVATAAIGDGGLYSFKDVAAGTYAMGIQNPDGDVAPVAAEPVAVKDGELVRRDLTLVPADADLVQGAAENYGLRIWWVSRTKNEKIWTVVAVLGGLALIFILIERDNRIASVTVP